MAGRTQTKVSSVLTSVTGAMNDATDGVHHECTYAVVDTSTDSTTVYSGPCIVVGIFVNTVLSAHTVILKDNATSVITLPASLAAGTNIVLPGIRFETSLVVDPDNSSTGNITVMYKPL